MTIKGISRLRRWAAWAEALAIVGLPFLSVGGESALRFDLPTLRLHFFGATLWMDEFFIVLLAILFLAFLLILTTLLFGRLWCGWLCPQTVLSDLTAGIGKGSLPRRALSLVAALALGVLVGANLIWYFVSPYEFIPRLIGGALGTTITGIWAALSAIVVADLLFVRRTFCATVCPYAKLQGVMFDSGTMTIGFDPARADECMDCAACVRACPVGIDIRAGASSACIACAACVDACSARLAKKDRPPLIDYFFGAPGGKPRIFRAGAVVLGVLTLAFLALLVFASASRSPLALTVLPNEEFMPRIGPDGRVINSYVLVVANRGPRDEVLSLSVADDPGGYEIEPESVRVPALDRARIVIQVSARVQSSGSGSASRSISISARLSGGAEVRGKAPFRMKVI
jgi:polyferredoxin